MANLTHVNNFLNRTNSDFFSTPEFVQAVEANVPAVGGTIDGTMVAVATATGTPEENGQSIIDAYNTVAGNHYDTKATYPPFSEPVIVNLTTIVKGVFPMTPGNDHCLVIFDQYGYNPLIEGKKYKGTITTVDSSGNNPIDATFYFIVIDSTSTPGQMYVQYCTYGDEAINGDGFFKKATRTPSNPEGDDYNAVLNTTFNFAPGQDIAFEEIITVKPTVILPPGVYELPTTFNINMPVNFTGLSKDGVVLNMGAHANRHIKINYGCAQDVDFSTGEITLAEVYLKDQSITFSNITFDFGAFNNDVGMYFSSFLANFQSGIRLIECSLYGGFGNGFGEFTSWGYVELNGCELHTGVHLGGVQYGNINMRDCTFIGSEFTTATPYSDAVRLGDAFSATSHGCHWDFDNCHGKGCYFNTTAFSTVKANHSTFQYVFRKGGDISEWQWNYVRKNLAGGSSGNIPEVTNYCVGF